MLRYGNLRLLLQYAGLCVMLRYASLCSISQYANLCLILLYTLCYSTLYIQCYSTLYTQYYSTLYTRYYSTLSTITVIIDCYLQIVPFIVKVKFFYLTLFLKFLIYSFLQRKWLPFEWFFFVTFKKRMKC